MSEAKECPRCSESYTPPFAALSRRDNKTEICPACGTSEALEDYAGVRYDGKVYWEVSYMMTAEDKRAWWKTIEAEVEDGNSN